MGGTPLRVAVLAILLTCRQNENEATVIIHLARLYVKQGKQYRVITPYDAQRTLIEKQLKLAGLPWEDKCFNVDSFQGK